MRSDPDRGLHNHPFTSVALVLAGGYWEDRLLGFDENQMTIKTRYLHPGSINRIDRHCFHRLSIPKVQVLNGSDSVYIQPVSYSLFICKYIPNKSWGFLNQYDPLVESDGMSRFVFRKHGNTRKDNYWWKSAPKGKFLIQ